MEGLLTTFHFRFNSNSFPQNSLIFAEKPAGFCEFCRNKILSNEEESYQETCKECP